MRRIPPSTTSTEIYQAIWSEVGNAELGLYIACEPDELDNTRMTLQRDKPEEHANCTIANVPGAILIIRPGVDLDAHI
jgi:hypothetical protein